MPAVTAAGHLGPGGCDESASMSLTYTSGATATLATHSKVQLPNEVREQTPPSHIIVKFWPLMGSVSNEAKIYACYLFSLTSQYQKMLWSLTTYFLCTPTAPGHCDWY